MNRKAPSLRLGLGRKYKVLLILVLVLTIGAFGYWTFSKSKTKQAFISPFQLLPYVSHQQARTNICDQADLKELKKLCKEKYDAVSPDDEEKIDELFSVLDKAKNAKNLIDYDKFLVSQLVFATLPTGNSTAAPTSFDSSTSFQGTLGVDQSLVSKVYAQKSGMSQEEYTNLLAEDLTTVLQNCPTTGYENFALNASCSVYSWVDGKRQPTYSKTFAKVGGPCAFSDAGAVEEYKTKTIINTKMKSERDFTDESGVSNQIVCGFSCGSYNCPKYEEEMRNPYCSAKGSTIYVAYPGYKDALDIPQKRRSLAAQESHAECQERSYDYVKEEKGTTKLVKARNCEILGGAAGASRWDGDKLVNYDTFCCSCKRPVRDSYESTYDFTNPEFRGGDLLGRLLDKATKLLINSKKGQTQSSDSDGQVPKTDGKYADELDFPGLNGSDNPLPSDGWSGQRYRNGTPDTGSCFDQQWVEFSQLMIRFGKTPSQVVEDYRSVLQSEWGNMSDRDKKPWGSSANYINPCIDQLEKALSGSAPSSSDDALTTPSESGDYAGPDAPWTVPR